MSQQAGQRSGLLPLDGRLYMQAFWNTDVDIVDINLVVMCLLITHVLADHTCAC